MLASNVRQQIITSLPLFNLAPPRFTQIPVRVKALKLILKEIEQSTEPSAEEEVDNAEEASLSDD